jgi:hypothetical protein
MIEFVVGFACSLISFVIGAAVATSSRVKDEPTKKNVKG